MSGRASAPVFVVGSPRSGTTLLYHLLLSSGGFAVYHAETNVFNLLAPRFGPLSGARHRAALLEAWLPSEFFRRSGLDARAFRARVDARCRSAADLLREFMDAIVEQQGMRRWAECTPEHVLFTPAIARALPDALFLHIIRDGRDVACSMAEQGWIGPRGSQDAAPRVLPSAFYWEWLVRRGRRAMGRLPGRALEVRFERLIDDPRGTLLEIGRFLDHDLDYDRIQAHPLGTVARPNTSFPGSSAGAGPFQPVGRWRQLAEPGRARLEGAIGRTLADLGYALDTAPGPLAAARRETAGQRRRAHWRFAGRHWLKTRTPLGRVFTRTDLLHDFHAFDRERLRPLSARPEA
ncbi:MAG: sulfotransferase [Vicinamibacterales bacterium]